ncbi:MAG: hypothetical protein EBS19_06555 [Spirochaetia bacterium]|nr:hypothetical protein [Spirochaetia bacterium]
MPVPKKRKKMEEKEVVSSTEEPNEPSTIAEEPKTTSKKFAKTAKPKAEKVERAFEVIDQIDKNSPTDLEVHKSPRQDEQGIHFQFKLDLVRIEDLLDLGKKEDRKENSIVIDFTLPYFWNLPILNEITKTVVRELKNMKIIQ